MSLYAINKGGTATYYRVNAPWEDLVLPGGVLPFRLLAVSTPSAPRGSGTAQGSVLSGGAPVARPVRAYERETGRLVATTQSGADGQFNLTGLPTATELTIVSIDTVGSFNAEVADRVTV